jgi:hypothetical protein
MKKKPINLRVLLLMAGITLILTSCRDEKLNQILSLVPKDEKNKTDYVKNSILAYNDVNKALNVPLDSLQGRSINPKFASLLHNTYLQKRHDPNDDVRGITFSYAKILRSLKAANIIDLDKAQMSVIFGRYPTEIDPSVLQENNISQNRYETELRGRLTCILSYQTPGVPEKRNFYYAFPYQYDDAGGCCPPNCPFDPIQSGE